MNTYLNPDAIKNFTIPAEKLSNTIVFKLFHTFDENNNLFLPDENYKEHNWEVIQKFNESYIYGSGSTDIYYITLLYPIDDGYIATHERYTGQIHISDQVVWGLMFNDYHTQQNIVRYKYIFTDLEVWQQETSSESTGLPNDELFESFSNNLLIRVTDFEVPTKKYVDSIASNIVNVTYDELIETRNSSSLIPGMWYRITDYVTTTSQVETQSAGHQFDVIVTATDESTLNEVARAAIHDGDTYFTENGANLDAWEIKYALDNDTERFYWADATNGKGVIYYMKDEWNNECPYDFKNIQFKHPNNTTTYPDYYYTFSTVIDGVVTDHSMLQGYCYGNIMGGIRGLNYNVFLNTSETSTCHSNSFGAACMHNSFGDNCASNSFENCFYNSFGNECCSNSFGNSCNNNSFGNHCQHNSFRNNCYSNSFGSNCYFNSFGNNCVENSFGDECNGNSFGNLCQSNSFGNFCQSNSFGNSCAYNSFRNSASETGTIKGYCTYNHFDDGCSYNVIWNSGTTSSSIQLKNINVNRGVVGTNSSYNFINGILNKDAVIEVAKNSNGEIRIYNELELFKLIMERTGIGSI